MRAEQWLMFVVGGLGLYAVYSLITSKASEQKPEDTNTNASRLSPPPSQPWTPPPPPPMISLLQNIIGPAHSAPLRTGTLSLPQWYRGRIELPPAGAYDGAPVLPPMRPSPLLQFTAANTHEQIRADLERLGFGNVTVYMNLAEAANEDAIPLPDALANPTPGSRWFSAVWRRPNTVVPVDLPRELVLLWPSHVARVLAHPATGFWHVPAFVHPGGYTPRSPYAPQRFAG